MASNFLQRFYEAFGTISSNPNAGIVAASLGANLRKFLLANYVIYYKPNRGGRDEGALLSAIGNP